MTFYRIGRGVSQAAGATLPPEILGIENILKGDLRFLRATAKNTAHGKGSNGGNAAVKAIEWLHQNKMYLVGGLIVGTTLGLSRATSRDAGPYLSRLYDSVRIGAGTPLKGL